MRGVADGLLLVGEGVILHVDAWREPSLKPCPSEDPPGFFREEPHLWAEGRIRCPFQLLQGPALAEKNGFSRLRMAGGGVQPVEGTEEGWKGRDATQSEQGPLWLLYSPLVLQPHPLPRQRIW